VDVAASALMKWRVFAALGLALVCAATQAPAQTRVFNKSTVIFVQASDSQLVQLKKTMPEDDFETVADDLSFYRSSATEFLEQHKVPYQLVIGRQAMTFLIKGVRHKRTFADVQLLDFIIVYVTGQEPRVVPTNQVEDIPVILAGRRGS
jgi:hypothetical protein